MASTIKRWNGTAWIVVADFDAMASGSKWLQGAGSPSSGLLATDSFYINTTNKDVYYRTNPSGGWFFYGNLVSWNNARGTMMRGTLADQGNIHDVPAAGQPFANQEVAWLTFTPEAGRNYRFHFHVRATALADGSGVFAGYFYILRNDVSLISTLGDRWYRTTDTYGHIDIFWPASATQLTPGVSAEFSVMFNNSSGETARFWMDSNSFFSIDDMGPYR
jgi:hypothetical protein